MLKVTSKRFATYLAGAVAAALIGTALLLAQGTTGAITGVVTDPSGAVIPSASVTITNDATGARFQLQTNMAGVYNLTSVIPGKYSVQAGARGFRTYLNHGLTLTVDQTLRIDVRLEVGSATEIVTVEAAAPLVNTEEGRLSGLVTASQVQNMPLNGRNIYDLMQLVPGAINATGINMENAAAGGNSATNVNGNRLNFNGYLLDGVSNRGLTGNANAEPSPDFVQEFRIMTTNFSPQYGENGGSITDVSIRSGTNQFHGTLWEYGRNDKLNARNFFDGATKQYWRQNQFGADFGGPIKKNKLFFFGGYEGERFRTQVPQQYLTETPDFHQAVQSALPGSVAALVYSQFPGPVPTQGFSSVDSIINSQAVNDIGAPVGMDYFGDGSTNTLISDAYVAYADPCFLNQFLGVGAPAYGGGPNWGNAQTVANNMAAIFGITAAEHAQIASNINAVCPGAFTAPGAQSGAMSRTGNMLGLANAKYASEYSGEFYNGDQYTARLDYQGDKNRIFGRFYNLIQKVPNYTTDASQVRGFTVPYTDTFPAAAFGFVRTFTPNIVNELRVGFTRYQLSYIPSKSTIAVPTIGFDTGDVQFGAYNGYPQFFNENEFDYRDMLSVVKGKHSLKFGGALKKNQENSEFNVGRPSYYFFDQLWFAAGLPYEQAAGVNPELLTGLPSHLDTNIREWRNYELGFFAQDDWKVTKNLTLNLGLRWDYYRPNYERLGKTTKFVFAPGANATERLANVNCQAFLPGKGCIAPSGDSQTPNGGFTSADQLFNPDFANYSPRFGFAWDPRGNGKTAIRGGFAIFYQAQIYNPLSNSRWNLPYYSFNIAAPCCGYPGQLVWGPFDSSGNPDPTRTPTFTGPPDNPGQGPASNPAFAGNIYGWWPGNPNLAYLTGIPDPTTRSPYVENGFFGFQREIARDTVLEVNWVGTFGHKLFWADNPNRVAGGLLRDPSTITNPCTGQTATAHTALLNPCFGTMRTWKNSVNSSYNALQATVTKKMSRGFALTSAYTWSHALDYRSDWHALTSGASADWADPYGSSGYAMDTNRIFLEHADSNFDIRQRWVTSVVWELPWLKGQRGATGKAFGGWQANTSIQLQSGFPFTVGAHRDYNKDGLKNDRPDTPSWGNSRSFTNTDFLPGSSGQSLMQGLVGDFPAPPAGHDGNLGRNTFHGPGFAGTDFSLFKKFPITERAKLEFRAEFFNLFNRVNFYQPVANLSDASFGLVQRAFDPRVIQFGLRLDF